MTFRDNKLSFSKYGKLSKSENGEANIGTPLKNHINHREVVQTIRLPQSKRLSALFIVCYRETQMIFFL